MAEFAPLPGDQYPLQFIEHHHAVKLAETDEGVVVGLAAGSSAHLLQTLRVFHRAPVRFVAVDSTELQSFLGRMLSGDTVSAGGQAPEASEQARLDRLAHDAPIVNLVNSILIDGIRSGASDIHVEAFADGVRVRYRIDGVLQTATHVSRDSFAGISSRLKVMANLNIMERRLPQDGRITVTLLGREFDIRVSIVPIAEGESVVLRLFDHSAEGFTLEELGFADEQLAGVREMLRIPHGLVLVTGPTGSGKTTTLTAIVREIESDERKIITIEDPVEYRVPCIDQIQTNEAIGLTFASLLRRVLRQDPDVIMVGEIRDAETAGLAIRAALTGHLVLASLHTNNAVSSIARLVNMGIEPYLVGGVLRGVIAQRLVRRVCRECGRVGVPSESARTFFARAVLPVPTAVPKAVGCAACRSTGYQGRTAIAEMFTMDRELERVVSGGGDVSSRLNERGFRTISEIGLDRVRDGATTLEEIEHVVLARRRER